MPRPDLSRISPFFHNYINQVPQQELMPALRKLGDNFITAMKNIPPPKYDFAYAQGKWTLKEVFQHIIDTERVFAYRALCFARKEEQDLPGFDENTYAASSKAAGRNWDDLIEEFMHVRKSTALLFAAFDHEQLESAGSAGNNPQYVLGIGFTIAGHCQHHLNIINERYL